MTASPRLNYRALLFAGLAATVLVATPVLANRDSDALDALRALSANPSGDVPEVLSTYEFREATYLLDGLSRRQLSKLRAAIDERAIKLPPNIEGAVVGKAARSGINRQNP